MPVPKVGSLDQDKYMNKCMSWASDEHSEMAQDQKAAMCMTAWRDSKKISQSIKKALTNLYNTVKKQLASYRTTVNGDNPHYHYYEIDIEGNGKTSCTIATGRVVITIDPHEHKISKWQISSAKKHTHGMDVIEKSANGKKTSGYTNPSQSVFKAFEKYHRALKGYYKPIMGSSINKSRINKSYLEKVISKVLKMIVSNASALPVGTVRDRSGGKYKKVAPGQWERVKGEPKGKPKEELEDEFANLPEFDLPESREGEDEFEDLPEFDLPESREGENGESEREK